jgi:hypothetical protein
VEHAACSEPEVTAYDSRRPSPAMTALWMLMALSGPAERGSTTSDSPVGETGYFDWALQSHSERDLRVQLAAVTAARGCRAVVDSVDSGRVSWWRNLVQERSYSSNASAMLLGGILPPDWPPPSSMHHPSHPHAPNHTLNFLLCQVVSF